MVDLGSAQHLGIEIKGFDRPHPLTVRLHLGFGAGQIHDARLAIADIHANTFRHDRPQAVCRLRHWHVRRRTTHLADPAEIARGLFAGNTSLLEKDDGNAPLGQNKRSGQPYNAATDDDDSRLGRKSGCGLNGMNGGGHICRLSLS